MNFFMMAVTLTPVKYVGSLDKILDFSCAVGALVGEVKLNLFSSDFKLGQNSSWDDTVLKGFCNLQLTKNL